MKFRFPFRKHDADACQNPEEPALPVSEEPKSRALFAVLSPGRAVGFVKESFPLWFDFSKPAKEEKRFPLSLFASVVVVAVCLFLLVSGNVMVTAAEVELANLQNRVKKATSALSQTETDLEAGLDLLTVRKIAVDEYGMVGEEYLKNEFLSSGKEEKVEVFSESRKESAGLSDWLRAIGIK